MIVQARTLIPETKGRRAAARSTLPGSAPLQKSTPEKGFTVHGRGLSGQCRVDDRAASSLTKGEEMPSPEKENLAGVPSCKTPAPTLQTGRNG